MYFFFLSMRTKLLHQNLSSCEVFFVFFSGCLVPYDNNDNNTDDSLVQYPCFQCLIDPTGHHDWQCMMNIQCRNEVIMGIFQCSQTTIGLNIKNTYRSIVSCTNDVIPGGVNDDTFHPILMSCEDVQTRCT